MKALLMHRDRDFDINAKPPGNEAQLSQDMELNTLLQAMAADDPFLLDVSKKALLSGLGNQVDTIVYRQEIVKDCLANRKLIRALYDIVVDAIEQKKKHYFGFSNYPSGILSGSIETLELFVDVLKKLRTIAESEAPQFQSEGFTNLFAMLKAEFSDDYIARIAAHLSDLRFKHGVLVSAQPGIGNQGTNYVLRQPRSPGPNWLDRLLGRAPASFTFHIADRDQAGARALSQLRDRGIHLAANALAQSMDHIVAFFGMLRTELAFYVGCVNLQERLDAMATPICFPVPQPADLRGHRFDELFDVCLALRMDKRPVGNSVDADRRCLVIVTGANQGGKSSFLRSIGVAQLMMQCGMFVGAQAFAAEICAGLFTHYKREEDATMTSGKFDEELARMNEIAEWVRPNSMLLFNESFASTNEREGSEIARQIVSALLERRVKVFFVTHQYQFSHDFFASKREDVLFLRADRQADGTRTFRLVAAEPLETSYGEDLYREIFEDPTNGRSGERGAPSPTSIDEVDESSSSSP